MPAGYVSVMAIPLTVDALGLVIVMVNCEELATPEVTVDGVKDTLTVSGRRVADAGRASEAAISSTTIEATTAAEPRGDASLQSAKPPHALDPRPVRLACARQLTPLTRSGGCKTWALARLVGSRQRVYLPTSLGEP